MTARLRYGIIGSGMMAREHVRNLALIPGSEITAIADPDHTSRETAVAAITTAGFGTPAVFANHHALLNADLIDAVIIASPNDTHSAILHDVFNTKRPIAVLCEKPVCTRADAVDGLRQAARAHPAPVWIAMEYRYMPPLEALRAEIVKGTVGTPHMLSLREHRFPFLPKVGNWNRFNVRTGGTLVEKCCHFFDLMRLILQSEPVRVYASGSADVNHRDEHYAGQTPDILDNAFVVVDFASGARASLDLCMFAEGAYFQEEIALTGDKARVEVFIPGVPRFWQTGDTERTAEIEISPRKPQGPVRRPIHVDPAILKAGDHHGSTYFQHLKFRAAVLEGAPVEVTMADGLTAVMMGLAAEKSARIGQAVLLAADRT